MLVAVEAFLDVEQDLTDETQLLRRFGDYVDSLGIQPVTVTISSLVEDMRDSYATVTMGLPSFSWKANLESLLHEFVTTRDCFFYTENRAPAVEVEFSVVRYGPVDLDVELHFSWNPPVVDFPELNNVTFEGKELVLRPVVRDAPSAGFVLSSVEYAVNSEHRWLDFNPATGCYQGVVPGEIASHIGAERFNVYTIPLELTARATKYFPRSINLEKLFRCVIPLTVKRSVSQCAEDEQAAKIQTPKRSQRPSSILMRPPLLRSTLRKTLHERSQCAMPPVEAKQDDPWSMSELCKLLKLKAERGESSPPLPMDSLSFARLHDAMLEAHLPSGMTDVEVRMLRTTQPETPTRASTRNDRSTSKENVKGSWEGHHKAATTTMSKEEDLGEQEKLGEAEVDRHESLSSGLPHESPSRARRTATVTPPRQTILSVPSPPSASLHQLITEHVSQSERKRRNKSRGSEQTSQLPRLDLVSDMSANSSTIGSAARATIDANGPESSNDVQIYTCTVPDREIPAHDAKAINSSHCRDGITVEALLGPILEGHEEETKDLLLSRIRNFAASASRPPRGDSKAGKEAQKTSAIEKFRALSLRDNSASSAALQKGRTAESPTQAVTPYRAEPADSDKENDAPEVDSRQLSHPRRLPLRYQWTDKENDAQEADSPELAREDRAPLQEWEKDQMQEKIQQNFAEFLSKKEETLDVDVVEYFDAAESDFDSSLFASDVE